MLRSACSACPLELCRQFEATHTTWLASNCWSGIREAAIRALVYIGLAGTGIDERRFEVLRRIRAERGGEMTLEEFKQMVREQFFSLLLDQEEALAAIPRMLPEDPAVRKEYLDALRRIVTASGKPEGLRAERLAEIEAMFRVSEKGAAAVTVAAE